MCVSLVYSWKTFCFFFRCVSFYVLMENISPFIQICVLLCPHGKHFSFYAGVCPLVSLGKTSPHLCRCVSSSIIRENISPFMQMCVLLYPQGKHLPIYADVYPLVSSGKHLPIYADVYPLVSSGKTSPHLCRCVSSCILRENISPFMQMCIL